VNGGVDISKKPVWIEGPHIFMKDGWYYLTAAEGGTSVNHSQVVLRSKNLRGPFVPFAGNPILTQRDLDPARPNPITSAGHAKLVQTPAGEWFATFLAVRPYEGDYYNIGRETFLLPVTWKNGWPIILPKGQAIPFASTKPKLPPQAPGPVPTTGDFSYVDEFNGNKLAMQWVGVRTPKRPFYHLEGGDLVLDRGTPIGDLSGVPAFVGRRQQHHVATASTTVRFIPGADGERAGLAAMQSDQNYLFFGLTQLQGKQVLALYTADKGQERLVASAPIAAKDDVTLTIRADGGKMAFDCEAAGGKKTLVADVDVRFLSTKVATGFVGTLIGPYAWTK
jgi:alpha-N-arabinofuranosidase